MVGGRAGISEASEALASGTEFKGMPQNLVIKINNILMQYFKKN